MITFEFHEFINSIDLNTVQLRIWITDTILEENLKLGIINYELLKDEELLKMNIEYLDHDTYTDIITFNSSSDRSVISGDIFISFDRVKDNSGCIGQPFRKELLRVMIHGVLHLCGYNDHTTQEKSVMRQKEDYYLTKYLRDVSRETK